MYRYRCVSRGSSLLDSSSAPPHIMPPAASSSCADANSNRAGDATEHTTSGLN